MFRLVVQNSMRCIFCSAEINTNHADLLLLIYSRSVFLYLFHLSYSINCKWQFRCRWAVGSDTQLFELAANISDTAVQTLMECLCKGHLNTSGGVLKLSRNMGNNAWLSAEVLDREKSTRLQQESRNNFFQYIAQLVQRAGVDTLPNRFIHRGDFQQTTLKDWLSCDKIDWYGVVVERLTVMEQWLEA